MSIPSNLSFCKSPLPPILPIYHNVDEAAKQLALRLVEFASEIFEERPDLALEEEIEDSDFEELLDDFYGKDVEELKSISSTKPQQWIAKEHNLTEQAAAASPEPFGQSQINQQSMTNKKLSELNKNGESLSFQKPAFQTARQVDRTAAPKLQNRGLNYNMDAVLYETTGLCLIQ